MRAYLYMTSKKTFSFSCSTLLIFLMRSKHHARLLTSNIYEYFYLLFLCEMKMFWKEMLSDGGTEWNVLWPDGWVKKIFKIECYMLRGKILFLLLLLWMKMSALEKILNIDQKKFFHSYIAVFSEWKLEEGMNLFMTLWGNKSKLEMCVYFNCVLDFLSCWCDIWKIFTQSVGTLN